MSAYLPWPREQFEMYVKAMPQSEAQTALIYFMNFMAELYAAQAVTPDLSPLAKAMLARNEDLDE
jgi:hypothetical protein